MWQIRDSQCVRFGLSNAADSEASTISGMTVFTAAGGVTGSPLWNRIGTNRRIRLAPDSASIYGGCFVMGVR